MRRRRPGKKACEIPYEAFEEAVRFYAEQAVREIGATLFLRPITRADLLYPYRILRLMGLYLLCQIQGKNQNQRYALHFDDKLNEGLIVQSYLFVIYNDEPL